MLKNAENSPFVESHETEQLLTGAEFMELLGRRWEMLELSPYTDRNNVQNGPAQLVYDKVRSEIEPGRPLTDEQVQAVRYLASETSLLDAQLLVDSALISDPDKFEQAVHEACDNLVETRDEEAASLSQQDVEELDDHIAQLSITLDRLDGDQELPSGAELLDYLSFTDFANAWAHQSVVDINTGKTEWIDQVRDQKRQALEQALAQIEAQWRTYLMLSQRYPSKLAAGEGLNEQQDA